MTERGGSGRRKSSCASTPVAAAFFDADRRENRVEFLYLVLIITAAFVVLRRPDRERLAFRLLVISTILMVFLCTMATRTGILPGVNY